jgi:hypothetical protein
MQWDNRFITAETGRCWVVTWQTLYSLIEQILRVGHTVTFKLEAIQGHIVVSLEQVDYEPANASATPINYLDVFLVPALERYLTVTFTAQAGWFWIDDDMCAPQLGAWMGDCFSP